MANSIIYLFDNKKKSKKFINKTLFVKLEESHIENYNRAKIRKAIADWQGALLYINQAISQNKFVDDYHILKMEIFLELNQFDYAVVNCFKAYFAEGGEMNLDDSKVMSVLKMHFINFEKDVKEKLIDYVVHYLKIKKQVKNNDEFALKLAKLDFFHLDDTAKNEGHEYGLFLELKENTEQECFTIY